MGEGGGQTKRVCVVGMCERERPCMEGGGGRQREGVVGMCERSCISGGGADKESGGGGGGVAVRQRENVREREALHNN